MSRPWLTPPVPELVDYVAPVAVSKHADAYQSLFARSGICMATVDMGLRVLDANEQFRRDLGAGGDAPVGRELLDFVHQGAHGHLHHQFVRLVEGRSDRVVERVLGVHADDGLLPAQLTAVAVREQVVVTAIVVMLQWEAFPGGAAGRSSRRKVLTPLNARILEGVASGMSTVNLAIKLHLSRQGVEYHVGTMLKKLKVSNRAALVSRAYTMGVLTAGAWPPRVDPEFVR